MSAVYRIWTGQEMPVVLPVILDRGDKPSTLPWLAATILLDRTQLVEVEQREPRPELDISLEVLQAGIGQLRIKVLRQLESAGVSGRLKVNIDLHRTRHLLVVEQRCRNSLRRGRIQRIQEPT